jgi:hypothetical protein
MQNLTLHREETPSVQETNHWMFYIIEIDGANNMKDVKCDVRGK